jgi:hypothetical protein
MGRKTQLEPLSAVRMPPHLIRVHLISRRPAVWIAGLAKRSDLVIIGF